MAMSVLFVLSSLQEKYTTVGGRMTASISVLGHLKVL